LAKKILAFKPVNKFEDRGLVIQSQIIENLRIIASYCPYPDLIQTTIQYLNEFAKEHWVILADWESFGGKICKSIENGMWYKPTYSRSVGTAFYNTEYIGSFKDIITINVKQKISDHYLIEALMKNKLERHKTEYAREF